MIRFFFYQNLSLFIIVLNFTPEKSIFQTGTSLILEGGILFKNNSKMI